MATQPSPLRLLVTAPPPSGGRDELNIVEFPIALLTDRPADGLTSISFSDTALDRGQTIKRTVTVEGSAKHGLPMPFDMDVLLCLMQLTKIASNFSDATLQFGRGEILKLMRLADSGANYTRLDESLHRWHSISLFYDQAWWDKAENCWTSQEGIHVFEHLKLITRRTRRRGNTSAQLELFRCSITWNSVLFKSFQAGNIKYLDMDQYFSLKRPISRQMYRFLDKRFWHSPTQVFDLRKFAHEHIGLSRNYDTGEIKSKLQPSLEELEERQVLEPLTAKERYEKVGKEWKIRFIQRQPTGDHTISLPPSEDKALPAPDLVTELVTREVTKMTAADLVHRYPPNTITAKLEVFDWLREKSDKRIAKSPAGYLVDSIRKDYAVPKGFVSAVERQKREEDRQAKERKVAADRRRDREREEAERAELQRVDAHWESMTPLQQAEIDGLAPADTLAMEEGPLRRMGLMIYRREHIRRLLNSQQQVAIDA